MLMIQLSRVFPLSQIIKIIYETCTLTIFPSIIFSNKQSRMSNPQNKSNQYHTEILYLSTTNKEKKRKKHRNSNSKPSPANVLILIIYYPDDFEVIQIQERKQENKTGR